MMTMKLLPCILLVLVCTCKMVAQTIADELAWKRLYAKDPSTTPEKLKEVTNIHFQDGIYLIKLTNKNQHRLKHSNITIKRQLDEQFFIVQVSGNWIKENSAALEYITEANNNYKLSPALLRTIQGLNTSKKNIFHITVNNAADFIALLNAHSKHAIVKNVLFDIKTFSIETNYAFIASQILPLSNVVYIDNGSRLAKEETFTGDFDNTVNSINLVHAVYPSLTGNSLHVSVKENKFDTTDIDLKGRIIATNISSNIISGHATNMATLIAGGGNSFYTGKGAAWGAQISSADFKTLLPDNTAYQQYKINVQNHSYGTAIENYYGNDAAAYDASTISNPSLIHIFSSGNSGNLSAPDGVYKGIPGYANLTGSFKMAKNVIVTGSTNAFGQVPLLSSKGPTYDGRVKPELVAFGESGSSESAAITSGISLLMQDAYARNHAGALPENALVKALLINSANDVMSKGIDFSSGYGSVDAFRSVQNMTAGKFFAGSIKQGEEKTFSFSLPVNARNLKLTLVWNDTSAAPNAVQSLVNDLDVKLMNPQTGETWLPWVLNSSPHIDSLQQLPVRKRDSLNVVEQISIDNPSPVLYEIKVRGTIVSGQQTFYIAYQWDTLNSFRWTYPTYNDFLKAGSANVFRWNNQYSNTKGRLEYSIDKGTTWKVIDTAIDLSKNYYQWNTPDTMVISKARMIVNTNTYSTDSFSISKPLQLNVGFDCPDSLLLFWNKVNGVNKYIIYSLHDKYLKAVNTVSDTSIMLAKATIPSTHFAVAPVFDNTQEGIKSQTINYTLQGTGCYIKNFLADLQADNTVALNLNLGTNIRIKQVHFEKQTNRGWVTMLSLPVNNNLTYSTIDKTPISGVNHYRAKLELMNGKFVYSDIVVVYYLGQNNFIVFPNPLQRNQPLQILSKDGFNHTVKLVDIFGRTVWNQKINNLLETISVNKLSTGIYILLIEKENKKVLHRKIIIR